MSDPPGSAAPRLFGKGWPCELCGKGEWRRLMFLFKEGEPPGEPGHVFVYNELQLYQCGGCLRGSVNRMAHDCGDWEDVWSANYSYAIEPAAMQRLVPALAACPRPDDAACECSVHLSLRDSLRRLPEADVALELGGSSRQPVLYPAGGSASAAAAPSAARSAGAAPARSATSQAAWENAVGCFVMVAVTLAILVFAGSLLWGGWAAWHRWRPIVEWELAAALAVFLVWGLWLKLRGGTR